MLEKTLLHALTAYRIKLSSETEIHSETALKVIYKHIDSCQDYLNNGNKANGTWMAENHSVLSKAVKYSHDVKYPDYEESCNDVMSEEHQDLNKCVMFFDKLYERHGVDLEYMSL